MLNCADTTCLRVRLHHSSYPEEVSGCEVGVQLYHILLVMLDDKVLGERREYYLMYITMYIQNSSIKHVHTYVYCVIAEAKVESVLH